MSVYYLFFRNMISIVYCHKACSYTVHVQGVTKIVYLLKCNNLNASALLLNPILVPRTSWLPGIPRRPGKKNG
jgi:hypothetical protein